MADAPKRAGNGSIVGARHINNWINAFIIVKSIIIYPMSPEWHASENLEFLTPEEMRARLLEAQEFSTRVNTLTELSLKIDAARSREEIVRILKDNLRRLIEGECAFIGLLSHNKTHYVISALSPLMDAIELDHKHFSIDVGMPGWSMQNKAGIMVDIDSAPSFHPTLEGALKDLGIRSLIIVPVHTHEEMVGALVFGSSKPNAYVDPDLWLARLLSLQMAITLRHSVLLERAQKRAAQIGLVNQVARKLTSTLNIDELLSSASEAIQKDFQYFDVTIFLINPEENELVLAAHSGNFIDFLPHGYRQKVGMGIVGWVAEHGQSVLANDVSLDARFLAHQYHNTNSELAIPIVSDDQVVGVLNVEDCHIWVKFGAASHHRLVAVKCP